MVREDLGDSLIRELKALEEELDLALAARPNAAQPGLLDDYTSRLSAQQRALNEHTTSLPTYDVRRYQTSIDGVVAKIHALEALGRPKPKFSFKTKKTPSLKPAIETKAVVETTAQSPKRVLNAVQVPGALTISGQAVTPSSPVNLNTHPALLDASTVTLHNFRDAEVTLTRSQAYTSVTLRDLTNCRVDAGVCTSAIFLESCQNCEISGEAQQFRIHTCHDCTIQYVCSTGRPVIEDCTNMQFRNLATNLDGRRVETIIDDFSNLSATRRNWTAL